MSKAAFFDRGRQAFATKEIDWVNDDVRVILTDLNDVGVAITNATNATPIVVTATAHGFSNGQRVLITGVGGNTAANGVFIVANVATNTFELTHFDTEANVAGNGSYTSGGVVINLSTEEDLADIPAGARVAVSGALAGKSATAGILDANDFAFSSVSGDVSEALIYYFHTGTEATSTLLFVVAESSDLPITPDGNNINVTHPAGTYKIARL